MRRARGRCRNCRKALLALVAVCLLFYRSASSFLRKKGAASLLQLLGAGCLIVVVVTHICEALHLFPSMHWGLKHSAGHYPHTWTERDLSKVLKISLSQEKEATAVLQLQGYVEPVGDTEKWRVSEQGDLVSGARSPRFTLKAVQDAIAGLRDHIKAANDDRRALPNHRGRCVRGLSDRCRVFKLRKSEFV